MKVVLFVLAVIVLLWLLRGVVMRRNPRDGAAAKETPRPMIACAFCGVHLPRDEALPGRGGAFCGDAHRAAFEEAQAKK